VLKGTTYIRGLTQPPGFRDYVYIYNGRLEKRLSNGGYLPAAYTVWPYASRLSDLDEASQRTIEFGARLPPLWATPATSTPESPGIACQLPMITGGYYTPRAYIVAGYTRTADDTLLLHITKQPWAAGGRAVLPESLDDEDFVLDYATVTTSSLETPEAGRIRLQVQETASGEISAQITIYSDEYTTAVASASVTTTAAKNLDIYTSLELSLRTREFLCDYLEWTGFDNVELPCCDTTMSVTLDGAKAVLDMEAILEDTKEPDPGFDEETATSLINEVVSALETTEPVNSCDRYPKRPYAMASDPAILAESGWYTFTNATLYGPSNLIPRTGPQIVLRVFCKYAYVDTAIFQTPTPGISFQAVAGSAASYFEFEDVLVGRPREGSPRIFDFTDSQNGYISFAPGDCYVTTETGCFGPDKSTYHSDRVVAFTNYGEKNLGETILIPFLTRQWDVAVSPQEIHWKIYREDGRSRKNNNGIVLMQDVSGHTGFHTLSISTANHAGDAGFWAPGHQYSVRIMSVLPESVAGELVLHSGSTFRLNAL